MILPKNKEGTDNLGIYYDSGLIPDAKPTSSSKVPSKHIISADSIVINKELGVGEFGVVQQGVWTNEDGDRVQVAIKCLSKQRMPSNSMDFLKEAAMMHSIDHEHIVRLYGVVLDSSTLMLVTELAPLRSLLECLKESSIRNSFPVISLCDFSHQICDGMRYLENKRLIHRDLAARNILVFAKNRVKISDFGLSRALEVEKDYYQTKFNVNLKLPIAWCAPECINFLKFTSASDVWAYGVTLWEMFSYGFQPWAALTGQEILTSIDKPNYHRLEKPDCCPKEYYLLMLKCWDHEPENRPKFSDIAKMLPDCRPELVQAVKDSPDSSNSPGRSRKDMMQYKIGDVITVLEKRSKSTKLSSTGISSPSNSFQSTVIDETLSFWKGTINGKTGFFNPSNTVTYLGQNLPAMSNGDRLNNSSNFIRGIIDSKNVGNGLYVSKRRLRPDMISRPQADLKHTGHVGADGAFFGDIGFLGDKYQQLQKQSSFSKADDKCSTSMRNSTDLSDKTPLLNENRNSNSHDNSCRLKNGTKSARKDGNRNGFSNNDHEYHEISDEENFNLESPQFESFDFGPSLMDEVFKELDFKPSLTNEANEQQAIQDSNTNVKNEIKEFSSKFAISKDSSKKKSCNVKQISAADQQSLDSAIAMAKEYASRSMLELDGRMEAMVFENGSNTADSPKSPTSPNKKKFTFKFKTSPKAERRNFSAETEKISDIQSIITDEAKEAYESLIEKRDTVSNYMESMPLNHENGHVARGNNNGSQNFESEPESNPLRLLRNGCSVIPKVRGNKQRFSVGPQTASLARLASMTRSALGTPPPVPVVPNENNALPLPPRDRSKPGLQALKHHQRKHPLLLPLTNSVHGSPNGSAESLTTDHAPVLSTFRPHMPVLKQVSCPEPPPNYTRKSFDSMHDSQNSSTAPPAKPARSFL